MFFDGFDEGLGEEGGSFIGDEASEVDDGIAFWGVGLGEGFDGFGIDGVPCDEEFGGVYAEGFEFFSSVGVVEEDGVSGLGGFGVDVFVLALVSDSVAPPYDGGAGGFGGFGHEAVGNVAGVEAHDDDIGFDFFEGLEEAELVAGFVESAFDSEVDGFEGEGFESLGVFDVDEGRAWGGVGVGVGDVEAGVGGEGPERG